MLGDLLQKIRSQRAGHLERAADERFGQSALVVKVQEFQALELVCVLTGQGLRDS